MALSAISIESERKIKKELKSELADTHTEEIIIGLCGPIGTNIHEVGIKTKSIIEDTYGYDCRILRLSEYIKSHSDSSSSFKSKMDEIQWKIDRGNELRLKNGNMVLSEIAISEIAIEREKNKKGTLFPSKRICWIIDSIKNNEELDLFRLVYGNMFYCIGVFSNLEFRIQNLEKLGVSHSDVFKLIDRDSGEPLHFGQKVTDTFMQSDYFLRLEDGTSKILELKIDKFLSLLFDADVLTPTCNETAMYHAYAAAGSSACLSRQVGAAILAETGEVISVGWNDVPRFGGGLYTTSEKDPVSSNDHRCINKSGGECFNDSEKALITKDLLDKLINAKLIKEEDRLKTIEVVKNSRIKELIEFSRAVHAEMHAIIAAAGTAGNKIKGSKLFCTTYPCHNCARHIVAAGIVEVYYIEPYRKSLATKLHKDSITEAVDDNNKLKILMFDGVAPRRYLHFFRMHPNSRKNNGKFVKPNKKDQFPKTTVSLQAIPILEKKIIEELQSKQLIKVNND